MTSHAAVVARGMGKCCVAGCGEVDVDYRTETMKVKGYVLKKGDVILELSNLNRELTVLQQEAQLNVLVMVRSGPPELPGFAAASNWRIRSVGWSSVNSNSAEMAIGMAGRGVLPER